MMWSVKTIRSPRLKSNLSRIVTNAFSTMDVKSLPMPSLSPTMTQGQISNWKKKPGDQLRAGDILCDIETDKATMGFELQDDGVLAKLLVSTTVDIKCGEPIALVVEDEEAYKKYCESSLTGPVTIAGSEKPAATVAGGKQRLSPAARHMIESNSLNVSNLVGTAKGGLISKEDVILAVKSGSIPKGTAPAPAHHSAHVIATPAHTASITPPMTMSAPTPASPAHTTAASTSTPQLPHLHSSPTYTVPTDPINSDYTDIPNNNMRKIIAKRLTESKATVPHFYTSIECEIDDLMTLRKTLKRDLDLNISVNDFVIKSAALALRDVPQANAKWSKLTVQQEHSPTVDISVAVATPNGLITPIVTTADQRGVAELNTVMKDLGGRAKAGKLKPAEFQGGTFSISNLGMFGISSFSAVINPPQACILAVGSGVSRVLPPLASSRTGKPRVVTLVTVQLSGDRRVVDEAAASQFLQVFQKYFSKPTNLLM